MTCHRAWPVIRSDNISNIVKQFFQLVVMEIPAVINFTTAKKRTGSGGRLLPGHSINKHGHLISDEQIKEWLCEAIEGEGCNYGYKKLTMLLRRSKGLIVNHKKVYWLYKELKLLKPQHKRKNKHPRRFVRKH